MTTEEDDGADCEEDAPTATTAAGGESATDNYSSLQCKCGARGPNRCVCSQEVSPTPSPPVTPISLASCASHILGQLPIVCNLCNHLIINLTMSVHYLLIFNKYLFS